MPLEMTLPQATSLESKGNILVVDDEADIREGLQDLLTSEGYAVDLAQNGTEGLHKMETRGYDLVLLDLMMPDRSGMEVLQEVRERDRETPIFLITAYGSVDAAVQALKLGANDYFSKPWDNDKLIIEIDRMIARRRLEYENTYLKRAFKQRYSFPNIIGKSERMVRMLDLVAQVATSRSTILITGETGTGKELVAKAIHANSARADKMFVAVNSGSLPSELLESTLFGHMRGAFTSAVQTKKGYFEVAFLGLHGAGESAPHVAEQRRFQQLRRQRSAVDRHEHLVRPRGVGVDGFGHQLLTRAGLTGDQDGGPAGGHLGHQVEHPHHPLALANDVGKAVALLKSPLEVSVLIFEAPPRDHAVDLDDQLVVVPGLGKIIVGAQLERLHRGIHRAISRDQEDGGLAVALADFLQYLHPGTVRHHQIEQHQVVAAGLHFVEAFGAVLRQVHRVAFGCEQVLEAFADVGFVVDHQNVAFGFERGSLGKSHFKRHSPGSLPRPAPPAVPGGSGRRRSAGWQLQSSRHAPE